MRKKRALQVRLHPAKMKVTSIAILLLNVADISPFNSHLTNLGNFCFTVERSLLGGQSVEWSTSN